MQVIPALGSGGVEIETIEMAKAIVLAGGRSLIAANMEGREDMLSGIPSQIEFINLPLDTKNPFRMAKNTKLLKKLIHQENVSLLHTRSRAPAWSAYKATHAVGIPFITTYHAAYSSKTVFKTFYNSVMARGDRVIAISSFIRDHILKQYQTYSWFDPSKVRLIQRGIDLHYFDPLTISQARLDHLKESWGIPPHMRLILLPGRLSRSKGHSVLIQALSLMEQTNVMAIFVGSALKHENYRDQLLQEASALDLEGRVRWFPPCPDLPAAYLLADAIVCPSLVPEGFGRILAEAQAMKKPIIASDYGASSEVIDSRVTGWLVPPGDPGALADALNSVLQLPQERLEVMGERGRERVKSSFSKEQMSSKTIDVYKELLGE